MYIILSSHVLTIFCVVIQLTTILHGNYSDLALICQMSQSRESLHILKAPISREISELTIVSKSWIDVPSKTYITVCFF